MSKHLMAMLLMVVTPAAAADAGWEQTRAEMAEVRSIHAFYSAFAAHDAEAMVAEYAPDVEFSDPAFGTLKGDEARAMWRMLIERGKDQLQITHRNVVAKGETAQADWQAWYTFSASGNFVHNRVHADFEFKNGKIWRHHDSFEPAVWACQALAPAGCWFGGQPFMQARIQQAARESLAIWIKAHPRP